jgi:hypothetical protein
VPPLPLAKAFAGSAVAGAGLYAVGGYVSGPQPTADSVLYTEVPCTPTRTPTPTPTGGPVCAPPWEVLPSPNVGEFANWLAGVVGLAPDAVWAVGAMTLTAAGWASACSSTGMGVPGWWSPAPQS